MNQDRRGDGFWLLIFLALVVAAKPAADAAPKPSHPRTTHHRQHARAATPPPAAPAAVRGDCAALPPGRIAGYARGAGFRGDQVVTAVAVALAESGGRPCAHNPVAPDDSYCLMQVNMLGQLGPERRARFGLARNADLYDPPRCMRAAYGISSGGRTWTPWTTFTRGTYRQFLDVARQAGGGG